MLPNPHLSTSSPKSKFENHFLHPQLLRQPQRTPSNYVLNSIRTAVLLQDHALRNHGPHSDRRPHNSPPPAPRTLHPPGLQSLPQPGSRRHTCNTTRLPQDQTPLSHLSARSSTTPPNSPTFSPTKRILRRRRTPSTERWKTIRARRSAATPTNPEER